ncbi:SDR family NAD(P)-dependent oxidoreductase [Sanyastnella coralliicola]|uniref:SDR family NAD(P)-dependent oxidoreductase n=1 Tax=Sanyastnella coralliicola TaxID=3069118 RepID=UPI0027BA0CF9|nr:SDR family oxidoreductase [Longitalea sp. SCSIO 12813]
MNNQKIALVTGGSRGIGREIVMSLAQQGTNVVFTYHSNQEAANEVIAAVKETGAHAEALQLDSRDVKSFEAFANGLKETLSSSFNSDKLDYLINNAGTGAFGTVDQTAEEQFDEMMNIHFKGVYFLTQQLLGHLNDGGSIVNISSGLTRFSFPGFSAYASMKGGVEVYTRYLAKELGSRGIRANSLAPGAIATEFGGGVNKHDEEKRGIISSITALGRVGEPEDIGGAVAFLCSDASKWVNGQRIEASGGMLV